MNQKLVSNLKRNVANLHLMYVKLHNYHWNVKGKQFFSLHELTERYYDFIAEQYDAVAERLLQLGEKPPVTMKAYLENATLQENSQTDFSAEQVVGGLVSDFDALLGEFREISQLAGEAGDSTTVNLVDGNIEWLEKAIWMLKANQ